MSRQAPTDERYPATGHGGFLLWSVAGAIALLALGVVLNRVLDSDVYVFYPGSLIINRAVPFTTYPMLVKMSMVLFNLVIWTAVIYAATQANAAWRRRRVRRVAR